MPAWLFAIRATCKAEGPEAQGAALTGLGPVSRTAPAGAVAQLGERGVRNAEVRGSIPLRSTTNFQQLHEDPASGGFFRIENM